MPESNEPPGGRNRDPGRPFTREEERRLATGLTSGESLACPSCGGPITRRPLPSRPDLYYVRHRVVLTCDQCRARAVVDST